MDQDVNESAGPPRDFVGYGRHAPRVRWPNGARVAVSIVMNYEEGSERSIPDGDGRADGLSELPIALEPGIRDLCVESVYEYGSRAGIWRVQRMVDALNIPLTFFGCAVAFERNPEVGAWIQEAGHEPCCHGYRWEEAYGLTREQEREHIAMAIESIQQTCGDRPRGWYCRYGPSVNTRELLVEEGGFVYDSDSYADDIPYYTAVTGQRHLVVPYSLTYNDVRFVLAQGHSDPSSFVDTCKRGLDYLREEGETHPKMMSIGLHSRLIGQAARASALKELLQYAQDTGEVWFATRLEIAEWWNAHHEEFTA
ncbi:MAG TPA: polysaccharide deacetylase family protein [Baekduia sp.]|jgi:peptidoglycan/xylan/chitin deacetylase (PgdA/CDA1 family)